LQEAQDGSIGWPEWLDPEGNRAYRGSRPGVDCALMPDWKWSVEPTYEGMRRAIEEILALSDTRSVAAALREARLA
jgi:hypothetical protein